MISSLSKSQREKLFTEWPPEELRFIESDWELWARPSQLPPEGDWRIWLLLAGRGFGKTRAGAEWVHARVKSGLARRVALVSQNPADARDVMIMGESGLLNIGLEEDRPKYEPSKRKLTWPNGSIANVYSGANPEQLRGPQFDTAWIDEMCAFEYPRETFDMLSFGMRLGNPQICITSTPKPIGILKEIIKSNYSVVTGGSTYENLDNLSDFYRDVIQRYEGTTLGEQELHAKLLDEMPGALWKRETLAKCRVEQPPEEWKRVVIGIDPAMSSHVDSSETGMMVGVLGGDKHGYLIHDLSGRMTPDHWARKAIAHYKDLQADRIVCETNNGGEMVLHTLRTVDDTVATKKLVASRGKDTRAEPIAALYEQQRIHHVGLFPELEDQLCTWEIGDRDSPDRLDALVWTFTELMQGHQYVDPSTLRLGIGNATRTPPGRIG